MLTEAILSDKMLSMARPRSIEIDRPTLERLYVTERLSLAAIAAKVGVSAESVRHRLVEFGIDRHPAQRRFAVDVPEEELRRLYEVEKLGVKDIAAQIGATYNGTLNALGRAGIQRVARGRQRRGPYQNRTQYARRTTLNGYHSEYCPDHPRAKKRGQYVPSHVLVVEKAIGRYLVDGEVVHHINLVKRDNRVENLAVLNNHWHAKAHEYMEHIASFLCGLTDIRPEALDFGAPVFWGGRYVTSVDLIPPGASPAFGQQALGETTSQETKKEVVN